MLIDITTMNGEIPRTPPHLLDTPYATLADNCQFERGVIAPCRGDTLSGITFTFTPKTIWRYRDDYWFAWRTAVNVIRSPVAMDGFGRVYWTGDGVPKYTTADRATRGEGNYPSYSFRLGIPTPGGSIHCTVSNPVHYSDERIDPELPKKPPEPPVPAIKNYYNMAIWKMKVADWKLFVAAWEKDVERIKAIPVYRQATPDPADAVTRFYTETWVSEFGEEGAPGKPSDEVTLPWPDSTVTLTLQPPDIQNSNITRRRVYRTAAGGGIASYLLVAELPVSQETFVDNIPDSQLTAPLETEHYLPPPEKMQGLCLMANGIAAGFTGNTLCFSAAYLPYAWPVSYQLTTTADIVAIAPIGTSLVVGTKAEPWLFSGVSPSSVAGVRLPVVAPCSSSASMVVMGSTVIYASLHGLVAVDASGAAQLISEQLLTPEQWQKYNPASITAWQWRGEYYAAHENGVLVFSPKTGTLRNLNCQPGAVYSDPERDIVCYMQGESLMQAQQGGAGTWHWRSKIFLTPPVTSFSRLQILSDSPARIGIRITADDRTVLELPQGAIATGSATLPVATGSRWQIAAWGTAVLERITLGTSAQEMPA